MQDFTAQHKSQRDDWEIRAYGTTWEEILKANSLVKDPIFGGFQMFAMSILSDVQELVSMDGDKETIRQYINRAKRAIQELG